MSDRPVRGSAAAELQPGDVVREHNADWPEPFTVGEFYDYTVAAVEEVNATTVHVVIATVPDAMPAAVVYRPDQRVLVLAPVRG